MLSFTGRLTAATVMVACLTVLSVIVTASAPAPVGWAPGSSGASAPTTVPAPSPDATDPASVLADDTAANPGNDGDEGVDPTTAWLTPTDGRIQLYPDRPSVLPGEVLRLHTSTTASSYSLVITREGSPERIVFSRSGYRGHDYRSRVKTDPTTNTTRANWPVTVSLNTKGWRTGIYKIAARDSLGRTSGGLVVVRDATPSRTKGLFVLSVMDYQAYNSWGGPNFYNPKLADRATVVSFDRPYNSNGGLSYFPTYDRYILRFLEGHGYPLAYTTDYDLSVAPPSVAPRVLILGQHTEYVPRTLFDWVDAHVNVAGDMNVAYFGANSFYWQVRLVPDPRSSSRTEEVLSYKGATRDPITATDAGLTTGRYRDDPVNSPEAALFGAMYSGIVDGGHTRHDMAVSSSAPAWALAGTGWKPGTVIRGILIGETDAAAPEFGGSAILSARATYHHASGPDTTLTANTSFRLAPSGGRVFDAGSFGWGAGLSRRWNLGVSAMSFDRFNRNVLAWLGLKATR